MTKSSEGKGSLLSRNMLIKFSALLITISFLSVAVYLFTSPKFRVEKKEVDLTILDDFEPDKPHQELSQILDDVIAPHSELDTPTLENSETNIPDILPLEQNNDTMEIESQLQTEVRILKEKVLAMEKYIFEIEQKLQDIYLTGTSKEASYFKNLVQLRDIVLSGQNYLNDLKATIALLPANSPLIESLNPFFKVPNYQITTLEEIKHEFEKIKYDLHKQSLLKNKNGSVTDRLKILFSDIITIRNLKEDEAPQTDLIAEKIFQSLQKNNLKEAQKNISLLSDKEQNLIKEWHEKLNLLIQAEEIFNKIFDLN